MRIWHSISAFLCLLPPCNAADTPSNCKCVPADPCWPSDSAWASLNATVSGRLIRTQLPASVCYSSEANYDPEACEALMSSWTTSAFHSNDPASVPGPQAADNSCNPIYPNGTSVAGDPNAGSKGCSIGNYPPYVVNATEAGHVQAAVKFAIDHNLRLNVKNTGHSSYRAVAHGSLSIWTHHMKGFEFHDRFIPAGCPANSPDAHMAATVGAGTQDAEVFSKAGEHKAIMVGGTNPDVGVLGWATGGGHGFMTTTYGTGASNILSASVVTLTGELVTANACQNTDIYWALRGGGSGTVGVVLSLTMAAYPEPFVNLGTVNIAARNGSSTSTNSTAWYATVARAHALLPALHDAGFQGYYVLAAPAEKGAQPPSFGLSLFNLEKDNATVQAAWRGFATALEKGFDNEQTTATASLTARVGTWSELYAALPAPGDSAGKGGGARTSRLISRKVVLEDEEALARTLERVGPGLVPQKGPITANRIVGSFVTPRTSPPSNSTSLHPAWRDAVVHLIVDNSWSDALPADAAREAEHAMTHEVGGALRELAGPGSGAYINECDENEPDWQDSLYGPSYGRLSEIKRRRDPHALLWCKHCVGGEAWAEDEDRRLCRAV